MAFLSGLFDALFDYTLSWDPLYAIIYISFILSLFIILLYKYATDQKEMKRLKDALADFQKKAKASRDNPEKMMSIQKEMMKTNMEYMKKSMKVTFITFIPMILILGWMDANFSYQPLLPEQDFGLGVVLKEGFDGNVTLVVPKGLEVVGESTVLSKDSTAKFKLKGEAGEYIATIRAGDASVDKDILVSKQKYAPVEQTYDNDVIESVLLGNNELDIIGSFGWLFTYFIAMLVFSIGMRKLLKVY